MTTALGRGVSQIQLDGHCRQVLGSDDRQGMRGYVGLGASCECVLGLLRLVSEVLASVLAAHYHVLDVADLQHTAAEAQHTAGGSGRLVALFRI